MGFFKDFKRDFAQAVNELMPDKDELSGEYDDEDIVNTFDEDDNMEIAPEDMLENLDEFKDEDEGEFSLGDIPDPAPLTDNDESLDEEEGDFQNIPDAEIITDEQEENESVDMIQEKEYQDSVMVELEAVNNNEQEDELVEDDALDESNMEENLEDALLTEPAEEAEVKDRILDADINQAVNDAISRQDDIREEDNMAEISKEDVAENTEKESVLSEDTAYITKGTKIKGDIDTDGGVDVLGTVEGNVTCSGKLIVGGSIKGNVNAGEIYSNASKIEGEITATGSVKIGVGSVVVGNVKATSAVIAGAVNGDIDVEGPVIVDSTAVIMGNIKSRSVQINNGAVIEGFCSQCYSEIDVKSFFE